MDNTNSEVHVQLAAVIVKLALEPVLTAQVVVLPIIIITMDASRIVPLINGKWKQIERVCLVIQVVQPAQEPSILTV